MSTVTLIGLSNLNFAFTELAAGPSSYTGSDPSENAYYSFEYLRGYGFTYDTLGRLYSGTVTSIRNSFAVKNGTSFASYVAEVDGIALPVAEILNATARGSTLLPRYAGADNTVYLNTNYVDPIPGNDTFFIEGAGAPGTGTQQSTTINGSFYGDDTAVFAVPGSTNLRADATLGGGGGDESVSVFANAASPNVVLTANLVLVDTILFIDGSVFEDNQSPGAQSSLVFEGILGRLPDAVNAGGYAKVADQFGTVTATSQLLATQEGNSDTLGLTTDQFVSQLYENMLHRAPDASGAAGWDHDINSGQLSRADVAARFASGVEAQQVNFAAFATGSVFAANPNSVEVLRAYELLLNRAPEASALIGNTASLDSGTLSLQALYTSVQSSQEFLSDGPNRYEITSGTPYGSVYAAAHSDPFNGMITRMVTNNGVAHTA